MVEVNNYKWYSKPRHSGNTLNKKSHVPHHIKNNFIKNRIIEVERRCNSTEAIKQSLTKLKNSLLANGYDSNDFENAQKQLKWKHKTRKKNLNLGSNTPIKLPFISNACYTKINKIIAKSALPLQQVSLTGPKICNLCKIRNKNICTCYICQQIGPRFHCRNRFVVYELTCSLCNKNYIGETCIFIKDRINQHSKSITKMDKCSALSAHLTEEHNGITPSISIFKLRILKLNKDPIETIINESVLIQRKKPSLNRKFELNSYNLDYTKNCT